MIDRYTRWTDNTKCSGHAMACIYACNDPYRDPPTRIIRVGTYLAGMVDVGAAVQQQLHNVRVAVLGCHHQHRDLTRSLRGTPTAPIATRTTTHEHMRWAPAAASAALPLCTHPGSRPAGPAAPAPRPSGRRGPPATGRPPLHGFSKQAPSRAAQK